MPYPSEVGPVCAATLPSATPPGADCDDCDDCFLARNDCKNCKDEWKCADRTAPGEPPIAEARRPGGADSSGLDTNYPPPSPLCDIPSGCCSFTGPWTVTRPSLRMLRRVAAFCRPLRPVLLLVSFARSRSPVVSTPPRTARWPEAPWGPGTQKSKSVVYQQ